MTQLEIGQLAATRARLRTLVEHHRSSIWYFESGREDAPFFRTSAARDIEPPDPETPTEQAEAGDAQPPRQVHGLTTAFTCIESLFEFRKFGDPGSTDLDLESKLTELHRTFGDRALANPADWRSETAAKTYCRVRGLAPLLNHRDDANVDQVKVLLDEAWEHVEARPGYDGVYEIGNDFKAPGQENQYPPSAYLTYWALASAHAAGDAACDLDQKKAIVELWLERCLAAQIALASCDSPRFDAQQIVWSVCGLSIVHDSGFAERPSAVGELVTAGLRVFFESQRNGTWDRGQALFHYPSAGNAYSYVYEALAELVHVALGETSAARDLESALAVHEAELAQSLDHLVATRRELRKDGSLVGYGWCSGHHPHRTTPESWATAGVYKYMQSLRRLFGQWTRAACLEELGGRAATESLSTLNDRGDSWDCGQGPVGRHLAAGFVRPVQQTETATTPDPDAFVFGKHDARSAMLFGPPGTGKTTLVEAVAGALGWPFVEITPATFLDEGIDMVSARADAVFDLLAELDRVVILFDEIDELIRARGDDADPLERFFTTTMLPRLAKLWKARKVMFFVNTNVINKIDGAITRSQRFDDAILVLPPSFEEKISRLNEHGRDILTGKKDTIYKALRDGPGFDPAEAAFAWFALLRHDQANALASWIASSEPPPSEPEIRNRLNEYGKQLALVDWPVKDAKNDAERLEQVLTEYRAAVDFQRRDQTNRRVVSDETGDHPSFRLVPDGIDDLKSVLQNDEALSLSAVLTKAGADADEITATEPEPASNPEA